MTLGGVDLKVGESVVVLLGAADPDPGQFENPDRLDFERPAARHLTFGFGPHFCLGANLARMEVGVAMQTLFRLAPNLDLTGSAIEWRKNGLIPGPSSLEVRVTG